MKKYSYESLKENPLKLKLKLIKVFELILLKLEFSDDIIDG